MKKLTLPTEIRAEIVATCLAAYPLEGCGLIAGDLGSAVVRKAYPVRNAAASARLYELDPREQLMADRDAEANGTEIIGVFHSHTHTEAYPSATDVTSAPDPAWHYVLVSFAEEEPQVRSFTIVDGNIEEESVVLPA